MLSREILANWLICAAYNSDKKADRLFFTTDPIGGDGILRDEESKKSWPTEHVRDHEAKLGESLGVETLISEAVLHKQQKGGAAYASGKVLVVFLNTGRGKWVPNRAAKQLPYNDFSDVWVVGLQGINEGAYCYAVTKLELVAGDAPAWNVIIATTFDSWEVSRIQ
jgi:hypothetical protein